jgi:hypothetical protein
LQRTAPQATVEPLFSASASERPMIGLLRSSVSLC